MKLGRISLTWKGDSVYRDGSKRALATIERDAAYPEMWRARRPNGTLTDMCNRTRVRSSGAPGPLDFECRTEP